MDETPAALAGAVLDQYYVGGSFIPGEIVAAQVEQKEAHERQLSSLKGSRVILTVPQRGIKRKLLSMAEENAKVLLEQRRLQWQHDEEKTTGAVEDLARIFDLPTLPERMECFDISHTQGIETVASMVVFTDGRPDKKEYRRFKLKTVQGKPDDFKSMAEIMNRRYNEKNGLYLISSSSTVERVSFTRLFPSFVKRDVWLRSSVWRSVLKKSLSKGEASPLS